VESSVLLRARRGFESRVPDPRHATQGDPAKRAVDEVGGFTSGLVLPPWQHPKRSGLIDPFSAQSDTNYLTLRESSPCAPTTRPVVDDIDLSKASTGQGGPFHTYSTPLSSRSALRT